VELVLAAGEDAQRLAVITASFSSAAAASCRRPACTLRCRHRCASIAFGVERCVGGEESLEPKAASSMSLGASAAWIACGCGCRCSALLGVEHEHRQPNGFRMTGAVLPPEILSKDSTGMNRHRRTGRRPRPRRGVGIGNRDQKRISSRYASAHRHNRWARRRATCSRRSGQGMNWSGLRSFQHVGPVPDKNSVSGSSPAFSGRNEMAAAF